MERYFARMAMVALLLAGSITAAGAADSATEVAERLRYALERSEGPSGNAGLEAELRRIYALRAYAPLWHSSEEGRRRRALLETVLAAGPAQGIETSDLEVEDGAGPEAVLRADRDLQLTEAFLRYAERARPTSSRGLGADWAIEPDRFDPAAALAAADSVDAFAELLDSLLPSSPQYARLVEALHRYDGIAATGGWPVVAGGEELKLDGSDPRTPALRQRLIAEGDLKPAAGSGPAQLEAAVLRFQARHGLEPDGRVGPRTLAELNVPVEARIAQILANLERWRHLPRNLPADRVEVNVAGATLDYVRQGDAVLHMRVVVGASEHPTPVLAATITGVTINPPWNVPLSIASREILPKLKRDPDYLAASRMIIVDRDWDPHGLQVDWERYSASRFPFRLRQLPGPGNSLGLIKLEMPNPFDVYLHDTPAKAAFKRYDRGLSHGCVRMERPADLALLLLEGKWNAESLQRALDAGETRRVALPKRTPVYFLYWTAFVDTAGLLNFRRDLYDRDRLEEFERKLQSPVTTVGPIASAACPDQRKPLAPG